jgi:trans-4-hydroxy-L-proline dehydratase
LAKEAYILHGYFNLPKVLEITLNNGVDPRSGKTIGLPTGDPRQFASFDQLVQAFERQVRHFVEIKVRGSNVIERLYARLLPAPFLSLLTDDCIASGRDYHDGGARYDTSYLQGVGIGTITDALSALRCHVFEGELPIAELLDTLSADFAGHERIRLRLLNKTPRYGNDDEAADEIMVRVFDLFYRAVEGRKNTRGGEYHINMLPTTCHVYFGSVTGATPDGRRAGQPLSEGVSPVQGADRRGPTAVIHSVAKMDHARTGGTLLNQKFSPDPAQGRCRAERAGRAGARLLQAGRAPHPVQRGRRRDAAPGAPASRAAPRPDRARRRVQRLLLRPFERPAGGDHRPHGAERVWLVLGRRGRSETDFWCEGDR